MITLKENEVYLAQGSGKKPYEIKKVGGVYSCSCPGWRFQNASIDTRLCKHIKALIDPADLLPQARETVVAAPVVAPADPDKAPPLLLAHKWKDEDPTGWWISMKADGVRAYWNGKDFISRLGNIYHAPEWFKEGLPNHELDGELYAGRGKFQQTVSAVRKLIPNDDEWSEISYMVFDTINDDASFEERQHHLLKYLKNAKHAYIAEQIQCEGIDHLKEALEEEIANGGEGLMLRQPGSHYESGRSHTLLKVKTFLDDEAVVVGHEPGKGRHKGRLGALRCRLKSGKEFSVGTGLTDKERENPPPLNSTITFKYDSLSREKIPRFPVYLRVRGDV